MNKSTNIPKVTKAVIQESTNMIIMQSTDPKSDNHLL